MADIPSGTKFLSVSPNISTEEKKSASLNAKSEYFTIEDIAAAAGGGLPSQTNVVAQGTDITSTAVLGYGINLVTADATDYAVLLPAPSFGGEVGIVNNSSVNLYVFPTDANSQFVGSIAGDPFIVPADGLLYTFTCVQNPNVGVWSVTTPYSSTSAKKTVTVDLVLNSSDNVAGSNLGIIVQNLANGDPQGIFIEATNAATGYFLNMNEFAGFTEFRCTKFDIKTNIPAGDLTTAFPDTSQNASTLMGITGDQLNTVDIRMTYGFWNPNNLPSTDGYLNLAYENVNGTFPNDLYTPFFVYNVSQGNSPFDNLGTTRFYTPVTGDPAHNSQYNSTYFQVGENLGTGNLGVWNRIFDDYGRPAGFVCLYAKYGDATYPASGFPAGFEVKLQYIMEFELR